MLKIVQACGDHSVEPANQISSVWERYYVLSCSRSCSVLRNSNSKRSFSCPFRGAGRHIDHFCRVSINKRDKKTFFLPVNGCLKISNSKYITFAQRPCQCWVKFLQSCVSEKTNCSFCLSFCQDDSLFFVFWMITSCMLIALK